LFLQSLTSRYLRVVALLLTLCIIFSLFVLGPQPIAVNLVPSPWDKLLHGGIFALLAWGIGLTSGLHGRPQLAVAVSGALLAGMLDEWHQMYLPGRNAGWDDLAADVIGGVIGTALLAISRMKPTELNNGN
jgi:VanZ family protein